MFEQLLKYKEEHGHCMVPKRYPANPQLGGWTHTQRVQYFRRKATYKDTAKVGGSTDSDSAEEVKNGLTDEEAVYRLTDDRLRRLEEVGFVWSPREGEKTSEQARAARHTYNDQWDGKCGCSCMGGVRRVLVWLSLTHDGTISSFSKPCSTVCVSSERRTAIVWCQKGIKVRKERHVV